jgi:hypothetical protein
MSLPRISIQRSAFQEGIRRENQEQQELLFQDTTLHSANDSNPRTIARKQQSKQEASKMLQTET